MSTNELTGKLSPKHMKELGTEMLRKDFEIIYIEKQIQDLIGNCRFYSSHEYDLSSSKILTEMVFGQPWVIPNMILLLKVYLLLIAEAYLKLHQVLIKN